MDAMVMKTRIRIKSSLKHFFNVFDDERGIVIPITLVIMVVMLIITGAFTNVLTYETRESAKFRRKIQAFYIADGAVERAVYQVNQDSTWRLGWSNVSLGAGTYSVTITDVSSSRVKITATATVGEVTRKVSRYANQINNQVPPFNYAAFGRASVTMSGNGIVNSYNSAVNTDPLASPAMNGDVGSNGTGVGVISLSGNATIQGDAVVGPGANPSTAISAGSTRITGSRTATSTAQTFPSVTVPATATALGNISLSGNNILTLAAGVYHATSISISGNAYITTTGVVTLYVSGPISISGNGSCRPQSDRTHDLAIYATDAVTSVSVSGNGTFYGTIYAPNANITMSGGGSHGIVCGAVVGNTITLSGGANLHYDENLASYTDQPAGSGAAGYSRAASWEGQ